MPRPTPPKISRYLPVWNRLKVNKTVEVTADPKYHRTIIKMIKNRRDKDTGYRYECVEAGIREQIKVTVSKDRPTVIVFKLRKIFGLGDL